jgi:hypothetical protein
MGQGLTYGGSDEAGNRITAKTDTYFQWRSMEWDYDDGSHATETGNYLVAEEGSYTLNANGNRGLKM